MSSAIFSRLQPHQSALRALGVRSLALFGSAARGQARQDSDLDFLVSFDQPNFDDYMDVKFRLEEIFSRRVDLVLESALKPALRQQVLAEAIHAPGF